MLCADVHAVRFPAGDLQRRHREELSDGIKRVSPGVQTDTPGEREEANAFVCRGLCPPNSPDAACFLRCMASI